MLRPSGPAALVLALLALAALPAGAQAAPPTCRDFSLVTKPGEKLPLRGTPCDDPDLGDGYEVSAVRFPDYGDLAVETDGYSYTPRPGYHGRDSFTYHALDHHGEESNVATVDILVDTAPACADVAATVPRGGQSVVLPDPSCGDADGDDFDVVFDTPAHGQIDIDDDGSLLYTPAPGFTGEDALTYFAEDDFGLDSDRDAVYRITVTTPATTPIPTPTPTPRPPAVVRPAPLPVAAPPDTLTPTITAKPLGKLIGPALAKGLRILISTDEGGTATATATVAKATARRLGLDRRAKGPVTVAGATERVNRGLPILSLRFTPKARRALAKARRLTLVVTVTVKDAAGNRATRRLTVHLKH